MLLHPGLLSECVHLEKAGDVRAPPTYAAALPVLAMVHVACQREATCSAPGAAALQAASPAQQPGMCFRRAHAPSPPATWSCCDTAGSCKKAIPEWIGEMVVQHLSTTRTVKAGPHGHKVMHVAWAFLFKHALPVTVRI